MKKLLALLMLGVLMLFGGCGDDDDGGVQKAKAEKMLGGWDITVDVDGEAKETTWYFNELVESDGVWGAAYEGSNYVEVCVYSEEDKAYGVLTVYEDGDMDMYIFDDILNEDEVYGICAYYDYLTDTVSSEYDFEGVQTSSLLALKLTKKAATRKNIKGTRTVTEKEKEMMKKAESIINIIKK